jgi:hypothetical protein
MKFFDPISRLDKTDLSVESVGSYGREAFNEVGFAPRRSIFYAEYLSPIPTQT